MTSQPSVSSVAKDCDIGGACVLCKPHDRLLRCWSVGEGSYLLIGIGAVIPFIVRELPVAGVELVARIVEHHLFRPSLQDSGFGRPSEAGQEVL